MITKAIDRFVDDILKKIESLGPLYRRVLDELMASAKPDQRAERSITLSLTLPGAEEAKRAFERLSRQIEAMM